jgi:hypothetical protein
MTLPIPASKNIHSKRNLHEVLFELLQENRETHRGGWVSLEELSRELLAYLLEPSRRRKGNPWFLSYFRFFFSFFFAFGTEITCRSNVAIAGLTLPTATKSCPRC